MISTLGGFKIISNQHTYTLGQCDVATAICQRSVCLCKGGGGEALTPKRWNGWRQLNTKWSKCRLNWTPLFFFFYHLIPNRFLTLKSENSVLRDHIHLYGQLLISLCISEFRVWCSWTLLGPPVGNCATKFSSVLIVGVLWRMLFIPLHNINTCRDNFLS